MSQDLNKIKDRILKLYHQSESEAKLGNEGAAKLFSEKVDEQLLKNSLSLDSILEEDSKNQVVHQIINELGKSQVSNPANRINAKTNLRKLWFEKLAEIVAEGYFCKTLPLVRSGEIMFYGFDLDREMAIYIFLRLAEIAHEACKVERLKAEKLVGKEPIRRFGSNQIIEFPKEWMGDDVFIDSFHFGFREGLKEVFKSHETNQETQNKTLKVQEYFEHEKRFDEQYSYEILKEKAINESAISAGKRAGINSLKLATQSSEALESKNGNIKYASKNIFLLLDISSSMYGDKIEQAKGGCLDFAKSAINENTNIGLITFGSKAQVVLELQKEVDENFINEVNGVDVSGSTNMTWAVKLAHQKLNKVKKSERLIVVITDGDPDSQNSALSAANDCKRDRIKIRAIGTDGANQEFLDKLCSEKGYALLVDSSQLRLGIGQMALKA